MPHPITKRRWLSKEALSLVDLTGITDPAEAMRKLVDDLLTKTEQSNPPINLPLVASFQGVIEIRAEQIKMAASLIPTSGGLRIIVNSDDSQGRQNFSAAHDICHTLFPNYRKNPIAKTDAFVGRYSIPQEEEYLCDIGAAYLLLPPSLVEPRVKSSRPCLDSVFRLAEDFSSSLEAAAIAWSRAAEIPCAIVYFEDRLKPVQVKRVNQIIFPGMEEDFRLKPELRVDLACPSESFPWFLPKEKHVSREGMIYKCFKSHEQTQGVELIELNANTTIKICAESVYAPYKKDGYLQDRVISFITPFDVTSI